MQLLLISMAVYGSTQVDRLITACVQDSVIQWQKVHIMKNKASEIMNL